MVEQPPGYSSDPRFLLSGLQQKKLAIATWLGMNLVARGGLSVMVLDEPLRGLDDVGALSMSDLLRKCRDRRQVFVSSHDPRYANLLSRKMFPAKGEDTTMVSAEHWGRTGPFLSHKVDRG